MSGRITPSAKCEHEWTTYIEMLRGERTVAQAKLKSHDPSQVPVAAYFKTRACVNCPIKERIDYHVGVLVNDSGLEVREFEK